MGGREERNGNGDLQAYLYISCGMPVKEDPFSLAWKQTGVDHSTVIPSTERGFGVFLKPKSRNRQAQRQQAALTPAYRTACGDAIESLTASE
jgi:hypothetical protein